MTHYEADLDLQNPNLSHSQVVSMVGTDKRVLDVGCASGYLGAILMGRGCDVTGVEIDPAAAQQARAVLTAVVEADLDSTRLSEHFSPASFDTIVFADVLEHLQDPLAVLADAKELLAPGGQIVISIPNVAHGSLRLALLQGRWKYTDVGLLDRTHIRFFTWSSLGEFLADAGLVADVARSTTADPLGVGVAIAADRLPTSIVEWVRHQPHALDFQFVVSAHVAAPSETPGVEIDLLPAVPDDDVRVDDVYSEQARAMQAEAHRMLTIRDHIVGLEAAVNRADTQREVARLQFVAEHEKLLAEREKVAAEKREIVELHAKLAEVAAEREAIRTSATWRIGRFFTAPKRALSALTR